MADRGRIWFEICAMEYGFSFGLAVQIGTPLTNQLFGRREYDLGMRNS